MPQRQLLSVRREFERSVREARGLASDAERWCAPGAAAHITARRRDSMIELAFFQAYLAWESFLEESFVLYLVGQRPARGRAPFRFAFPPSRRFAEDWVSEGREYATWGGAGVVSSRAERFFRGGKPYSPILRANQSMLDETRTIRNAVAHVSASAVEKFEKLVRTKIGTLPPGLTIGRFLATVVPASVPPVSFFEYYIKRIEFAAVQIVPA